MSDIDEIFSALQQQQNVLQDLELKLKEEAAAAKENELKEKLERDAEEERLLILRSQLTFLKFHALYVGLLYFLRLFCPMMIWVSLSVIINHKHTKTSIAYILIFRRQQQRDAERQAFYFEALRIEQQKEDERRRRKEEEDAKVFVFRLIDSTSFFLFWSCFRADLFVISIDDVWTAFILMSHYLFDFSCL